MFKPDVHGADPTILNSRGRKLAEQTVGVFYFWVSFSPTHGGHFHPCEIEEKIRNIEYNFDGVFNFIYSFRLTQAGFFTVEIGSISNLIHRFYAQNGEDYLLAKFFDFTQVGFYVDVGAFDGVHLSNSFCFEQMGWQGICVEPQKFYFDACVKNRPGSICVQAACVGNENKKEITLEIDETGLFSSTSLDLSQSNITGHYGQLDRDVSALGEEIVSASTLNSILKSNISDQCSISFLSIDVEGMEKEVLQGLDLKKYSPKVLVIETNTKEIQMEMTDYLLEYDFQFARQVGANSFYAKSEEDCLHLSTIEITCVIEKQIHPKGLEYTQSTYLHGRTLLDGKSASRILEDSRSFAGQLENRNNKVSKLLRDLDEARLERNTTVGSLLETNEALKLQKLRIQTKLDETIKKMDTGVASLQKAISEHMETKAALQTKIKEISAERNTKVATLRDINNALKDQKNTLQTRITEFTKERNAKVASLLVINKELKEQKAILQSRLDERD